LRQLRPANLNLITVESAVSIWAKRRNRQIKSGTWAEYLAAAKCRKVSKIAPGREAYDPEQALSKSCPCFYSARQARKKRLAAKP
jgi:hypothetical protein